MNVVAAYTLKYTGADTACPAKECKDLSLACRRPNRIDHDGLRLDDSAAIPVPAAAPSTTTTDAPENLFRSSNYE